MNISVCIFPFHWLLTALYETKSRKHFYSNVNYLGNNTVFHMHLCMSAYMCMCKCRFVHVTNLIRAHIWSLLCQ